MTGSERYGARRERVLFAVIALGAAAGMLASGYGLQPERYPEGLAAAFPGIVFGLLALVAGYSLIGKPRPAAQPAPGTPFRRRDCLLVFGLCTGYLLLLAAAGFALATLVFQSALLRFVFRQTGVVRVLLIPAAMTAAMVLVFAVLLEVPLPRGAWFVSGLPGVAGG